MMINWLTIIGYGILGGFVTGAVLSTIWSCYKYVKGCGEVETKERIFAEVG